MRTSSIASGLSRPAAGSTGVLVEPVPIAASPSRRTLRLVATIFDVAAEAGVSHQTVSRTLNGDPTVRPATRERIQAAVERLRAPPHAPPPPPAPPRGRGGGV